MKFIDPSFDILTDISYGGINELKHIERCGRVSYRSEDKISEDGESAKKFVAMLIRNGHESVLEHGSLTVEFTVDRAIANELVRHRMASYTQESTRYCNYSKDKFGGDLTYILPYYLKKGYDIFKEIDDDDSCESIEMAFYAWEDELSEEEQDSFWKFYHYYVAAYNCENEYLDSVNSGRSTPEEARWMLPLGLATKIVVTANYREWRHIFKLRCNKHAHPEMRRIMCALWCVLNVKIPVMFEDIRNEVNEYLALDEGRVAEDCVLIDRAYYEKLTEEWYL